MSMSFSQPCMHSKSHRLCLHIMKVKIDCGLNTILSPLYTGGDANLSYVTTLPNILRQYSPDLYGFSTGETPTNDFIDLPNTRLNVAMSGALSRDMLGQAQELVRKMQESPEVDFENDWKLVTVFIGFNDVCLFCIDPMGGNPDSWAEDIGDALDYLQENSPRTFINLVQMSLVGNLLRDTVTNSVFGDLCRTFYSTDFLCPCGPFGPQSIGNDSFDEVVNELQENIADLVNGDRFEASEDFTVVLQPFISDVQLEEVNGDVDISFLASDCLHFGPIGIRSIAIGLWNNMFERVGAKSPLGNPAEAMEILCPTDEQPFLFTNRNSGKPLIYLALHFDSPTMDVVTV